ncbi:MAG: redoxin domain-containing protein, partial [Gammaproteobacteria bacterium]|nr:redoxin domain-containing protein [Gammaproteobacteria bacterium]
MKPVHWAVLLVVLLTSGIVMINKYQPNSGMEEIMARPMDEVSSGGLLMSMDVTGLQRPAFSLPDVSGVTRHISEWDGSVIAINFWATWCLPCLKEVPQLVDLQTRYGNEGFQVIGIALQKAEELHEFIQEQAMNYPVLAGEIDVIEVA